MNDLLLIKKIIDSLTTRIMHDLINPIGSAQMASEQIKMGIGSHEILDNCLNSAIEKLEIFRFLFKNRSSDDSINNTNTLEIIKQYISNHNLNFIIDTNLNMPILVFFLTQKMIKKSVVKFIGNEITLESVFLKPDEIDAIENKTNNINSGNILPYLVGIYENKGGINIKEGINWQITIK